MEVARQGMTWDNPGVRRLTIPSIGILLWVLHVAPFVHVHAGTGGAEASLDSVVVHSHLPASESTRTTAGPAVDGEHSAKSIDVFASVSPKPFPHAVAVEVFRDAAPEISGFQPVRPGHAWQERGPPLLGPPLRAPPA